VGIRVDLRGGRLAPIIGELHRAEAEVDDMGHDARRRLRDADIDFVAGSEPCTG
jgi:hypothetical protein